MNVKFSQKTKVISFKSSSQEFYRRFKKDPSNVQIAVSLSRDIPDEDNSSLTREITMEKVWQAVK